MGGNGDIGVNERRKPVGIYAPTVTCFRDDEAMDEEGIRSYVRFLLDSGVHGIAPLGSAGEVIAMTESERKQALEWILEEVNGRVPVYAGTGHYSTRATIDLSLHAERSGATGLMLMAPYLLRPPKRDVLDHFRRVREATSLPIMLYNVPLLTGVELSPPEIKQLADEGVLQAVKWSHVEVSRIHDTRLLCGPDFSVFVGIDLVGFEGLAAGANGYVGGLAMMVPSLLRKVFDAIYVAHDLVGARDQWDRLLPLIQFEYRALFTANGEPHWLAVCREAAALRGIRVGRPRLPLSPLKPELREELRGLLSALGEIQ